MLVTSSSELLRRIFFLQRPHLLNNKTRIARSASRNIKDSTYATLQTFPGYSKCVWPCNNTCIVSKSNAEFEKLQIVPLAFHICCVSITIYVLVSDQKLEIQYLNKFNQNGNKVLSISAKESHKSIVW